MSEDLVSPVAWARVRVVLCRGGAGGVRQGMGGQEAEGGRRGGGGGGKSCCEESSIEYRGRLAGM